MSDAESLPALFISHGAPNLILRDIPARRFLADLADYVPRPKAVLSVSAHWETDAPTVDISDRPETIHDFYGFADELYQLSYPAAGAPDVALAAKSLLEDAGLGPIATQARGLDHGAWVPLMLPWPDADIPVCQLSIQPARTPRDHFAIGAALAPLRRDGILIMGTGNLNHNLDALRELKFDLNASTPDWAIEFRDWMEATITDNRRDDLLDYRVRAPHAVQNHPSEDHLLPLFVTLGASDQNKPGRLLHASYDYGVLTMDSFAFD